jgi:hypothetical protein
MTISRDLYLAILSMDSYNRGYGVGVILPGNSNRIGRATIRSDSSQLIDNEQRLDIPADFYAIAYDLTGAANGGQFADGETVIAYRGSDYTDTEDWISSDIWQGWSNAVGFPGGGQPGLALRFYEAVTGNSAYSTPGNVTITGHSLGGSLAGFVSALSGSRAVLFDHLPFGVAAQLQSYAVNGTFSAQTGLPSAYHVNGDGDGPIKKWKLAA